jgi:hypothetical protein
MVPAMNRAAHRPNWIVTAAAAALIACGGTPAGSGSAGGGVRPGTGAAMCRALTTADLTAVGLQPTVQRPQANPGDPPGSGAYCVWTKAAGAAGGIEFDIFYPADHSVYQTVVADGDTSGQPAGLPGIDEGVFQRFDRADGISVRRGGLVFAITIPRGPRSHDQLVSLARAVMSRTG